MKQESRFVADLYHYLTPFIDPDKPVFVSLDGIAAKHGVADNVFVDSDVPDLWFTLVGDCNDVLLEVKILNRNRTVTVSQPQLSAWRSTGTGQHKPSGWVAADEDLTAYFYWSHSDFLARLDSSVASGPNPRLRMPARYSEFSTVRQLALHVLRAAPIQKRWAPGSAIPPSGGSSSADSTPAVGS